MKLNIVCDKFKPMDRNTLRGFATITITEMRMTMKDIAIHDKNGARWAAPPSKPMIDKDGSALRDDTGRIKYANIIELDGRDPRDAFSAAVIAAVMKFDPNAL